MVKKVVKIDRRRRGVGRPTQKGTPAQRRTPVKKVSKSRKSIDKRAPLGANTILEAITDITEDIAAKQVELEELYRLRDVMYFEAQDIGATIPQMAKAASLSVQGVKYMLARARNGR